MDRLLTQHEVHALGGPSPSTQEKQRVMGTCPIPFVKVGRLVRYRESDVTRYIASLPALRSTAEFGRKLPSFNSVAAAQADSAKNSNDSRGSGLARVASESAGCPD